MSECIVRMEMPENCLKCHLRNQCEIFCDWSLYVVGTSTTRKPYPKPFDKGCRIICSLPEGHGPLVDAEKLKERSVHFCETEYTFDFDAVFVEDINEASTIVPAERSKI